MLGSYSGTSYGNGGGNYGAFSGHGGYGCCEDDRLLEILGIGIALMALMAGMASSRRRRKREVVSEDDVGFLDKFFDLTLAGN